VSRERSDGVGEFGTRKVGLVACSGEEIPEGTITRQATLKVLQELRPHRTVTICLPLYLAGGEADRAFARLHPTITVDGCERRCAERATARFSGGASASLVVSELVQELGLPAPSGARRLDPAGERVTEEVARRLVDLVDGLMLGNATSEPGLGVAVHEEAKQASGSPNLCSCGSSVPVLQVEVGAHQLALVALPLIFDRYLEQGLRPSADRGAMLVREARIYNDLPDVDDAELATALLEAYEDHVRRRGSLE
jgi:uncharacterized metal-binding protein